MSFTHAVTLTDMALAFAIALQCAEHLRGPEQNRTLFIVRLALALLLLSGFATDFACLGLLLSTLLLLERFGGPYNGGSDRMGLLILLCLCLVHILPNGRAQEIIFGYLALQLTLSYFIAGWVKITNPDWRSGRALRDVFLFSAYPASESLRHWASYPRSLHAAAWAVMVFELVFPLALLSQATLIAALLLATLFHFANACLFGLNRFFWVWLAAYPSLLWLQERLVS